MKISVVSPVYMGKGMLKMLVDRTLEACKKTFDEIEIILVNDHSPDESWEEIKSICSIYKEVQGVNLSKNFGQTYAICAGLSVASGDWIAIIDCDLQDNPEEIVNLYKKASEGFDVVLAQRLERQDSLLKRLSSKYFWKTLSFLTGLEHDSSVANFGLYKKNVIDVVNSMNEKTRYFPTMVKWAGYRQTSIPVAHSQSARDSGKSSYNWSRKFKLALDIILSNSDKPMRLTVKLGVTLTFVSVIVSIINLIMWLIGEVQVSGYTSLILSIWLLSGMIIFILGVMGLYIGKIFEEAKGRPFFIISEVINRPHDKESLPLP